MTYTDQGLVGQGGEKYIGGSPLAGCLGSMGRAVRHPGLHDANGAELPGRLLDLADCETYVVDAGDGPPILLLHGFGDTADSWRRLVPMLLCEHRVIAIDIPPFGRSGQPKLQNGTGLVDWYPGFLRALFDELGVAQATLAGHSLGGAIALHGALEHPKAVEQLVLLAPAGLGQGAPWWWHAVAGRPVNWGALLRLPNPVAGQAIKTGMRSFLEERLMDDPRRLEDVIDHFIALHGGRKQLEQLLATGRALIPGYDGTLIGRVSELDCPVTVIWGANDRLAPVTHADAFAAAVPHAVIHVLDRCGHYPQIELPARVNELFEELLDYESSESLRISSRTTFSRTSSSVTSASPRFRR
jgi:pimeloyl-ACP methyl ester carboxylesterase